MYSIKCCSAVLSHVLNTPLPRPSRTLSNPHTQQVFFTTVYYKRWKWAPIKSRRIIVDALF